MAANRETHAAEPGSSVDQSWTLTSLALRHKRAAGGSIAFLMVLVALTVLTTVSSPSRAAINDAATCSQWGAATPAQQIAYSHLYVNEYGTLPNTARYAAAVRTAIDKACVHASYLGEAADVSVLASLRHAF